MKKENKKKIMLGRKSSRINKRFRIREKLTDAQVAVRLNEFYTGKEITNKDTKQKKEDGKEDQFDDIIG